jgi:ABC-type sugar transport system substrate-binding protein
MKSSSGPLALASILTLSLCVAGCSRRSRDAAGDGESEGSRRCGGLPPLARKTTYTVGFVPIYEPNNPWGITNTNDMIIEARKRGYKLAFSPFTGDAAEQVARMRALIDTKVDAIILRPMDATVLAASVVAARDACIPVFTENRFVDGKQAVAGADYVTGIGADPVVQGQMVADWLINATRGSATIIEIEGSPGSSSAIGRKEGFDSRVARQPGMKIVASQHANFLRAMGHDVAKQLLRDNPTANAIYAHGDIMALGALSAVQEIGKVPGKDVTIVSIDGLKEAVEHVIDGSIAAILFNDPRLAAISLDTIEKYAAGQAIAPRITIQGHMIDAANARAMLAETF